MRRVVIGLATVFVLVAGGISWMLLASRPADTQVRYATAAVRQGPIAQQLTATGTLTAAQVLPVTAGVGGQILTVTPVTVGSSVQSGQVLATLINPQLAETVQADTNAVAQARANLQLTQQATGVVSAQLAVQQAQQHVVGAEQTLQNAQAALTAAQATLAQAQAAPAQLTVRAPVAGIVRGLAAETGQTVGANQQLATIASQRWLQVNLQLPQPDIAQLVVGQPLQVVSNGVVATGQLTAIGAAPARVVGAIADIPVSGQVQWVAGLAPGMEVTVETGPSTDVGGLSIPADSATGTLAYLDLQAVVPGIGGTVAGVVVADHADVVAGQALVLLANPNLQTAIANAGTGVQQAEQQVADDQAALADARSSLAIAQADAQNAAQQHAAQLQAAENQLQMQELTLQNDQASLADLAVRAPIAGQIASVSATVGAQVGAQSVLFNILAPGTLNLTMPVPQSNIDQVRLGQKATVTTDAVPGRSFGATVTAKSPVGVDTNGITNFSVTLSLTDAQGLLPGMAANAVITLKAVGHALLVPLEAVHGIGIGAGTVALPSHRTHGTRAKQASSAPWVAVLASNGTFTKVPVTLGINNGLDVQVTTGLHVGQRIVTSSLAALAPQTKLSVLGRVFHRAPQRTPGAVLRRGGKAAPGPRAAAPKARKGKG